MHGPGNPLTHSVKEREDTQKSRLAQNTLQTERKINSDRLKIIFSDMG